MKTVIKHLRLPFTFSAAAMQAEIQALATHWKLHYNTNDYDGDWSALPLRAAGGNTDNIIAYDSSHSFADTGLMQQCPYIQSVVRSFQCPLQSVRLLRLRAGGVIREHRDTELSFEYGEARIHVPVQTNPGVEFYLDGERMALQEGECWYMNFNLPHRIVNNSPSDRIHLVMDCMVNDWLRELFAANAANAALKEVQKPTYTDAQRASMIASLREIGSPTAMQLADEIEAGKQN